MGKLIIKTAGLMLFVCAISMSGSLACVARDAVEGRNKEIPREYSTVAPDTEHCRVEGTFVIPAETPGFEKHMVDIRLYESDPTMADVSARLLDQIIIKNFSHVQGEESERDFVIGTEDRVDLQMSYYVTVFILKDGQRTHMGKVPGEFLMKVLSRGHPRKLRIEIEAIERHKKNCRPKAARFFNSNASMILALHFAMHEPQHYAYDIEQPYGCRFRDLLSKRNGVNRL